MKNKLFFITILVLVTALFSGCNEDELLSKYPKDAPNAENFFTNETSARAAANSPFAIMSQIPWDFKRYFITMNDIRSDDSYTRAVGDRYPSLHWSSDVSWYGFESWWYCFYKGINNANFAIDGIPASSDPTFTPDKQAPYIAVAKLAKAFCYLNLATFWGDVPYYEHFIENPDSAFIPRTPKSMVMAALIEDLKYAAENLPHSWSGNDEGFPTRAAGAAMLAKAYLYNRDYANAVTAAKNALDIADAEGYMLMPDYVYMMSYESQANGDNKEFIYRFDWLENGESPNPTNEMMVERMVRDAPGPVKNIYGGGWGYALPSRDLVDAFEPGDPRRVYSMWIPGDFYGIYNEAESFTADSTYNKGDKIYYKAGWSYANTNTRKIWQRDMVDGTMLYNNEQQMGYDLPLLRYADLLLFYAEALIENNQAPEGMAQINRVRARASVNMPPLTASDQNDARKKLRHERRIELNMEGQRIYDLMRWSADDGVSGSYLEQIFGSGLNGKPILMRYGDDVTLKEQNLSFPKNLLFAIPQAEMDRNKLLVQNPGW